MSYLVNELNVIIDYYDQRKIILYSRKKTFSPLHAETDFLPPSEILTLRNLLSLMYLATIMENGRFTKESRIAIASLEREG